MTPNYGPAITGIPARRKSDGPRLSVYRDIPGFGKYVWTAGMTSRWTAHQAPLTGQGPSSEAPRLTTAGTGDA